MRPGDFSVEFNSLHDFVYTLLDSINGLNFCFAIARTILFAVELSIVFIAISLIQAQHII